MNYRSPSAQEKLSEAYSYCLKIAQNHYENFPVASRFLTKKLRYPISVVYAFARSADDFADEGNLTQKQRIKLLDEYMQQLSLIEEGPQTKHLHKDNEYKNNLYKKNELIFIALADVIKQFHIPIQLFKDLIYAFKSDVDTIRYQNFSQVRQYCEKSANPIGRILLYLNNEATKTNLILSDAICTGLQLINFYQDIAQDIDENNRLYIPKDEMMQFSVTTDELVNKVNNPQTQALVDFQLQRCQQIFESGKPLYNHLSGRFAIEIRLVYFAGQHILDKLVQQSHNIYLRPRLNKWDKIKILWRALF